MYLKRVLFIDSNEAILQAYKEQFQYKGEDWQTFFATDATTSMEILTYSAIDIVIADLRMPMVETEPLFLLIQKGWPKVVRVIVSPTSATSKDIDLISLSHRFITKPSNLEELETIIDSIYYLQRIVLSDETRKVASEIDSIPALPEIFKQLTEEINSSDPSMKRVGEIIARDVGLSADILKMINSPYFGLKNQVSSPEHATKLLGLEVVKGVALSASLMHSFALTGINMDRVESVVEHSLVTANITKLILESEKVSSVLVDMAFSAAILHDVGYLMFASSNVISEKYQGAIEISEANYRPLWEVEREILGTTHGEVGAYLLGLWGFPDAIVEAVAFHHTPGKSAGDSSMILCALHLADIFTDEIFPKLSFGSPGGVDYSFLERMHISSHKDSWRQMAIDYCKRITPEDGEE
jgi:putative nucleotidyltransferase with HDIG domain